MVEIQAFGTSANDQKVQWLISDQLGTPRMVLDQTGSLANMKRHDYLPFGEELVAPTGGRSAAQGYSGGDAVRQQFTSKERDVEIGLDYFGARYYSSVQGRFTGVDPLMASAGTESPQSLNRYAYVLNNPLRLVDPTGFDDQDPQTFTITNPCDAQLPGCNPVLVGRVTVTASEAPPQLLTTIGPDPGSVSLVFSGIPQDPYGDNLFEEVISSTTQKMI